MDDRFIFRGKLSNGQWAYGNLACKINGLFIITPDETPIGRYGAVDPATVGQCTGQRDKNGALIYEGDVLGHKGYPGRNAKCEWQGEYARFTIKRMVDGLPRLRSRLDCG